eukprot:CAMPEP_0116896146 /NCGR_PEP_ID=MMETSP0467-20121206/5465_1 /TAXON_ID=283647 /ORGANISM="Mesodinium pulex, Strain SPMC105" /LENGTH=67 /DNA_ID=CAMNT_0004567175 /DNA_START=933 /DNA_END=1136 /DNA_ORIENTATION=+
MVCWFYGNDSLPVSVSTPYVGAGPGFVSSLWGILLFNEIKGLKNYAILGSSLVLMVLGNLFIGISCS